MNATTASSSWSGHIVARILPKEVPIEYNHLNKPFLAQVPASTFVHGLGVEALRPSLRVLEGSRGDETAFSRAEHGSSATTMKSPPGDTPMKSPPGDTPNSSERVLEQTRGAMSSLQRKEGSVDEDLSVRIELHIFPPQWCDDKCPYRGSNVEKQQISSDPVTLVMLRKRTEPVVQCFKRMELTLAKKLRPFFSDCERSSRKDQQKGLSTTKGSPLKVSALLLHEKGRLRMEDSDMSFMTTEDFWSLQPSKSIQILVQGDGGIPAEISMTIESNPPTIIEVNAFEKFRTKIFPGVPLAVEVRTIFATGAVVDWYVDHKLVRHNSPWYMPPSEAAGKSIGVLITPTRQDHCGKGFEEAYSYAETIEDILPENTLLQVRPAWVQPREPTLSGTNLRVMTYNILADQNAFSTSDGKPCFPYVTTATLCRARRMPLILHEILTYNADLVCLQEVDEFVYETLFQPVMKCFNYQGFYSGKTSDGTQEGCAMFFTLSRFEAAVEADLKTIPISQLLTSDIFNLQPGKWRDSAKPILDLFKKRPDVKALVEKRLGHVVQIARLRDKRGNCLLLANTHLFFNPVASHVRALQCFAIAYKLSQEVIITGGAPFVLCGDFNSEIQNCLTLFTKGETPENFCIPGIANWREDLNTFDWDFRQTGKTASVFDDHFPSLKLPDDFPKLISAYARAPPDFTHFVPGFRATLDHILMTTESSPMGSSLSPVHLAPIPSFDLVTRDVALPSERFPSDHISILSDVSWRCRDDGSEKKKKFMPPR